MNRIVIILLNEVMKVNSVFEIMLGRISGMMMWKKVVWGLVLRLVVVCVSDWLKLISVVVIVMIMKGMFSVVWVRIMFR